MNRREFLQYAAAAALALSAATNAIAQSGNAETRQNPIDKDNGGTNMKHELPALPYAYNALEPHYDEQTVRLHHDKHHAAYVAGQNKAEEMLEEARKSGDFALIQHWEKQLAFHGAGNYMHTLFWQNMAPNAGGVPSGALAKQIEADFGSFESFKKQFSAAAVAVEGSGWVTLAWKPEWKKLYILQVENHQKLVIPGVLPLLVLDVWEHAYYLKYQNRRADWVDAWWNLTNWPDVEKRFDGVK